MAIATVKNGILWGMIVLIPAMAIAGGSGMSLGQGRRGRGGSYEEEAHAVHRA